MRMLLMKTIPVSIRKNIGTYILLTLLVAAGMYIASATAGITYSYNTAYTEITRASNSEDGQFQTYKPIGDEKEQQLLQEGYEIEPEFYFDVEMDDGSVLRVMKTRQSINKVILDEGKLPEKETEAVLEKCYAFHHQVKVSDTINCAGRNFLVTGLGSVTDYDSPSRGLDDYSSDSKAFGLIFVTPDSYQTHLTELGREAKELCVYSYKLPEGRTDDDLRAFLIDNLGEEDNLITFVPKENNNRMGSARNDNEPYAIVGIMTGIGLLVMISLIFYLRLRLTLERESPSIGALLAMGVKRRDIYPMLLVPFALAGLIGGLTGYILSRIFDLAEVAGGEGYYSIPEVPMRSHPLIFLYCVVMPPLVCTLINLLLMRKKMSQPVLSLLRTSDEDRSFAEKGILIAVLVGSLLTATIFMMGRGVGLYCTSVKERLPEEIKYRYVYELSQETEEVPEGAYGTYKHIFSVHDHGYIRNIQFIGVEGESPYFDVNMENQDGSIVISSAVASRYGLEKGDTLHVFDPVTKKDYDMKISGITNYSVMLTVFMNLHDLRSALGKEGTGYNMVYSDELLDYQKDQLFAMTEKEDLISPVEMLEPVVASSRDLLYVLAGLFYSIMIIYLVQFSIVESQRKIAILGALGYRSTELTRFFIGKLIGFSCVAAAVSLPLGYLFSKWMMPTLVASTPIGLMIDYHLSEYLINLSAVILIIVLSVIPGWKRIKDINILYYLRSRE